MRSLSATLIDVGWGDSILVESATDAGGTAWALIDSNDTVNFRSSQIFIKRFFERRGIDPKTSAPVFDFVVLSHAHSDHGQGLKALIREYGTRQLFYPKSAELSGMAYLLDFANRSDKVERHEALNSGKQVPPLGDATVEVLWPDYETIDGGNENNNSVVLALRLGGVSFVLTGDAEADVWDRIGGRIPADTRFFKVPHHGSVNGFFGPGQKAAWLDRCPQALLGISTHVVPFHHPHSQVISALAGAGRQYFRTDENYHVTFSTDGVSGVQVKYSRV